MAQQDQADLTDLEALVGLEGQVDLEQKALADLVDLGDQEVQGDSEDPADPADPAVPADIKALLLTHMTIQLVMEAQEGMLDQAGIMEALLHTHTTIQSVSEDLVDLVNSEDQEDHQLIHMEVQVVVEAQEALLLTHMTILSAIEVLEDRKDETSTRKASHWITQSQELKPTQIRTEEEETTETCHKEVEGSNKSALLQEDAEDHKLEVPTSTECLTRTLGTICGSVKVI